MDTVVKVMDLDVNIMDSETLNKRVEEYLGKDQLNILLLATSRLFVEAGEDESLRELLGEADAIIPSEESLVSMYPEGALERGGVVVNYQCLSDLLVFLSSKHYTLYCVTRDAKELQTLKDFFEYSQYNIAMVGGRVEQEFDDELIINEINGMAPDILLVDLDSPLQERWIMEHKTKVNSRLCVGVGGIMQHMLAGYGKIPPIFYALHLDGIYRKLVLNSKWMKKRVRKHFEKKVREFNSRKL